MSNDHLNSQPTFKTVAYSNVHEGLLNEFDFVARTHKHKRTHLLCSNGDAALPLTNDSLRCKLKPPVYPLQLNL